MYPLHVLLIYVLSAIMDLSCNLLNHALEAAASAYSVLYVPATKVIPSIRQDFMYADVSCRCSS